MKPKIILLISILFVLISSCPAQKGKHKEFKVYPFGCTIYVFTDSTDYVKTTGDSIPAYNDCQTIPFDKGFALFLRNKECLDHETIHLTWFILDFYQVKIDVDNHEIQAYLFEYIKSEINK